MNLSTASQEEILNIFSQLAQDTKMAIVTCTSRNIKKEELYFALLMSFKNYKSQPKSHQVAHINPVESECKKRYDFQFIREELDILWGS